MKTKKLNRLLMLLVAFMTMCVTQVWGAIEAGTYTLCTSTSDLTAGAHYIIASGTSSSVYCISNVSNSNNRRIVSATVTNSKIEVADNSTIMTFTLGGSTGAWTFYTDNYAGTAGYLASAASGSNNYCCVINTSTTATISFSNNVAVITLQPHTSRNILRFNSSSSLFACYSSGNQAAVYLYKKASSGPTDATWSVAPASVTVKEGKSATATITTNYDGTLSVASNATGIATASIDGKTITVSGVAEGSTTLTVTGAATSNYNTISKTIDVTVTANSRPVGEVFYESFDTNDGTGGNDSQWSGSIATSTFKSDNDGWTVENASGASECAKFGAGSKLGSAQTPAISGTGNFTLTFKAAAWNGNSESTTLKLSATNATLSASSVTLTKGAWDTYNVNITGATSGFTITFEGYAASNSRFFLDEVSIVSAGPTTYTASVVSPAPSNGSIK